MNATQSLPSHNPEFTQSLYNTDRFSQPEFETDQSGPSAPPMEYNAPFVEDASRLKSRVKQITADFFPSSNSTTETPRSSSNHSSGGSLFNWTSISLFSNNTSVTNTTNVNSRGSREKNDDKMSTAAQIAIFVVGAGVLIGSMAKLGTWVRQINDARESKSSISNYTSDLAQNIRDMDVRIIRSCGQKLGFGVAGVAFSIVGIAGAALGSFALVWTAAIGGVLTAGVFVFQWNTGELDTAKRIQQFYTNANTLN